MLSLDVVPRVWAWSCAALRDAELHDADSSHWWLSNDVREALFFVYAFTLFTTVHNLPFTYYSTFVIEERFGFNKTTRGTFVIDQLKALLIQALLIPPMLILLLKVIEWGGNSFYLYAWALYVVFSVAILLLAQSVIMPMFLTFTPLPDGQLRSSIERLAGALDFPLYKLFVIDGSKRSRYDCVYVYYQTHTYLVYAYYLVCVYVHSYMHNTTATAMPSSWASGNGSASACSTLCWSSALTRRSLRSWDTNSATGSSAITPA